MEELAPWEQDYAPQTEDEESEVAPWEQDYSPEDEAAQETAAQKPAVLPLPKANMFADMADEDAARVYDAYKRHPHTEQNEDGSLTYRGVVVPPPEGNSSWTDLATTMGGAVLNPAGAVMSALRGGGNELAESLAGGGLNATRSVGTGGVALGEAAGILPEGSFEATDEFLPEYNPEGSLEHAGNLTGQIGLGIVGGNKVAALASGLKAVQMVAGSEAAAAIASTLPKALNYIAKVGAKNLGASAGAAATLPGGTDTLAVGENALVPLRNLGVGLDEEADSAAVEELEARFNIFADSMLMAYPVEMAADAGKGVINFLYEGWLKPLVGAAHKPTQEKIVLNGIFKKIESAMGLEDPRQIKLVREKILDILKHPDNRKVIFQMDQQGIDDIDMDLDVATIIQRGLADDPSEAADILRSSFMAQRKGVTEQVPTGRTARAVERPERTLDTLLSQTRGAFGGDEAIQESAQRFQGVGRSRVEDAEAAVDNASIELSQAQAGLPDLIRKDGPLGEALGRTADESGSEMFKLRNEAGKEIIDTLDTGSDAIRDQKNQLWRDLPEGLPFDEDAFAQVVAQADEYLPRGLRAEIENVSDFKSLQNLRNSLSEEIARRQGGFHPGVRELKALRKHIAEEQPAFLRQLAEGDERLTTILDEIGEDADGIPAMLQEGADNLDDAVAYQKDVFGKTQKGAVKDIDDTRSAFGFDDISRMEKSRDILQDTLTSDQPDKVGHLIDTFSRAEYAGKPDRIADYIMADVADKLRTRVKSGGLGEIEVGDVLKTLQNSRQALANFPELAQRLDDFENNLISARGNISDLESILQSQTQRVKDVEVEVYEGVLKDFFHKHGMPKGSGYQSFQDLFNDRHGLDRLMELTDIAKEENPAVLDGMKSAYAKWLDSGIFNYTPTPTRPKSLSSERGADIVNKQNAALEYGAKLFEDKPVVMEAVEDLMRLSLDMNSAQKMKAQGESIAQALRDAVTARNRMVLAFVGPLTRVGARISSISSTILDKVDPNQTVSMIKDAIFSDPDEFVRVAEALAKDGESSEAARNAFQFLVKAGIYQDSDWNNYKKAYDELNEESQTQEVFNIE